MWAHILRGHRHHIRKGKAAGIEGWWSHHISIQEAESRQEGEARPHNLKVHPPPSPARFPLKLS